jgi:uncharacterized membrane protein YidH (DUF202 family)
MKKNMSIKILGAILGFLPVLVFAQGSTSGQAVVSGWTSTIRFIIKSLFPILISLAGILFMVQIIRFVTNQQEERRAELRKSVGVNLIILVILLGFFGLIQVGVNTLGLNIGTDITTVGKTQLGSWDNCKNLSTDPTDKKNNCTVRDLTGGTVRFISDTLTPTAVAIATLVFMWNLVRYLLNTDNETERTNARKYILWSLLALAIILTLFGILNIGTQTLFGSSSFVPQFPTK